MREIIDTMPSEKGYDAERMRVLLTRIEEQLETVQRERDEWRARADTEGGNWWDEFTRAERLQSRIDAVLAMEGVVFAGDPKERLMLAQGVVRRVLRGNDTTEVRSPRKLGQGRTPLPGEWDD